MGKMKEWATEQKNLTEYVTCKHVNSWISTVLKLFSLDHSLNVPSMHGTIDYNTGTARSVFLYNRDQRPGPHVVYMPTPLPLLNDSERFWNGCHGVHSVLNNPGWPDASNLGGKINRSTPVKRPPPSSILCMGCTYLCTHGVYLLVSSEFWHGKVCTHQKWLMTISDHDCHQKYLTSFLLTFLKMNAF